MVRKWIRENIFAYDWMVRLKSSRRNRILRRHYEELFDIDPVKDFAQFREGVIAFKRALPEYSKWLGLRLLGADSQFYGHLHALADYAELPYSDDMRLLLPDMEHGIFWLNEICESDRHSFLHNIVSQGSYRHEAIRKVTGKPHYVIGPYIHYANPPYSHSELEAMKKTLGRTVLVFPAHTYEAASMFFSREEYVRETINHLGEHFDTILVSCYWNDVDDSLYAQFESAGAKVVSWGLRSDCRFLGRLKSAMMLSDCVTGNTLGTHIGYAHYLNRPFLLLDGSNQVEFAAPSAFEKGGSGEESKEKLFLNAKELFGQIEPSSAVRRRQADFCRRYWGDANVLRTKDDIRSLFDISRDMLLASKGRVSTFEKTYRDLLREYENNSSSKREAHLLREALA